MLLQRTCSQMGELDKSANRGNLVWWASWYRTVGNWPGCSGEGLLLRKVFWSSSHTSLQGASEHPAGLVSPGVGPMDLHFWLVYRECWTCWWRANPLRTTVQRMRYSAGFFWRRNKKDHSRLMEYQGEGPTWGPLGIIIAFRAVKKGPSEETSYPGLSGTGGISRTQD